MSLSKLKSPKMKPIDGRDAEQEDVVSYTSVNNKTHTSFTAVTDPNSRHAARLAQIALSVQQNEEKKRHEKKPKFSSWLPQIGFSQQQQPQQLEYPTSSATAVAGPPPRAAYPNPGPQAYAYSQPPDSRHDPVPHHRPPQSQTYVPPHQVHSYRPPNAVYEEAVDVVEVVDVAPPRDYHYDDRSGTYHHPNASSSHHSYDNHIAQPPVSTMKAVTTVVPRVVTVAREHVGTIIPANGGGGETYYPVEVTRYRTEQKTAYQVRGNTRGNVLKVSAPTWSSEAQLFDVIAEANTAKSTAEYNTSDSSSNGTDPRYQGKLVKRDRGRDPRGGHWDGW